LRLEHIRFDPQKALEEVVAMFSQQASIFGVCGGVLTEIILQIGKLLHPGPPQTQDDPAR